MALEDIFTPGGDLNASELSSVVLPAPELPKMAKSSPLLAMPHTEIQKQKKLNVSKGLEESNKVEEVTQMLLTVFEQMLSRNCALFAAHTTRLDPVEQFSPDWNLGRCRHLAKDINILPHVIQSLVYDYL